MPAPKRLDVRALEKHLGIKKLRFGKPEALLAILALTPGAVSPLGLINDKQQKAIVIIAKEVWDAEIVGFHPNVNTATLEIKKEFFQRLMNSFNNKKLIVEI